jgi:hypothetical protein
MFGITLLFDKSFLQSLSAEESLWLDIFYISNICPYFYVETLADLKKGDDQDKAEEEVRKIAKKFPEINGLPNVSHINLCLHELLGYRVPMQGQIVHPPMKNFNNNGEIGFYANSSPEADAFLRWQLGQYSEIELDQAQLWRKTLNNIDLDGIAESFKTFKIDEQKCKSLEDCFRLASQIVSSVENRTQKMNMAFNFLQLEQRVCKSIMTRWKSNGYKKLTKYAPYMAYVLKLELFFQIAILNKLISSERKSNRTDISYLFYLPFTETFVTNDEQQSKWARFFLNSKQEILDGKVLKNDLKALNLFYKKDIPEYEKEKGIISLVHHPPFEGDFLTSKLWDKYRPNWRKMDNNATFNDLPGKLEEIPESKKEFLKNIKKNSSANHNMNSRVDFDPSHHIFVRQKFIRQTKGSWYQVHKDIPPMEED